MVVSPPPLDSAASSLAQAELEHLLTSMNCTDVRLRSEVEEDGRLRLIVEAPETGRLLIGVAGAHLAALEHILHSILRRRLTGPVAITVDVNDYRQGHERALKTRAQEAAAQAQKQQHEIILEPMSASDRRTIHTALVSHPAVVTESQGEGVNRRVVIRPRA